VEVSGTSDFEKSKAAPLANHSHDFASSMSHKMPSLSLSVAGGKTAAMVRDSDRANQCRAANQNSIGIEHVARDNEALTDDQAKSSAALIAWLLEQYDIPREKVFGHEFRHSDAAVRSGITGQITSMHPHAIYDAHEVRHGRAFEMSAGRLRVDAQLDIWFYHIISGINVITVFGRDVTNVLLLNREMSDRSI